MTPMTLPGAREPGRRSAAAVTLFALLVLLALLALPTATGTAAGATRVDLPGATPAPQPSIGPLSPPIVLPLVFTVESLDGSQSTDVVADRTTVRLATDVLFAFGKADLSPRASAQLRDVAARLSTVHGDVSVTGYTDGVGSPSVNLPLSKARAQAVAGALQPLVHLRFTVAGKGSADPVAPEMVDGKDNPAGRARNRRVEISFRSGG